MENSSIVTPKIIPICTEDKTTQIKTPFLKVNKESLSELKVI